MKKNKGFTLMEMLVVVAIIGILVAISIPVFSSQLDKAREATDAANLRAAKAVAALVALDGSAEANDTYYFDADQGKLVGAAGTLNYGKQTGHKYVVITFTSATEFRCEWSAGE